MNMERAVVANEKLRMADPSEIEVEAIAPEHSYSSHVNLIPLQGAVQGPRMAYGSRFFDQALPLVNREAPLVQSLSESGKSFDEIYGPRAGAVVSDADGVVKAINKDHMILTTPGGDKKVDLYDNFPFNRKTGIHNTPVVKVGDKVTAGGVLAKSNYTDDKGTLAMGVNARVGLLAYKGHSTDDAIVISDSFARRLSSEHTDTISQDFDEGDVAGVRGGMDHFVSLFPNSFSKEQLAKVDEAGVVKPGTVLKKGDPIILASKPRSVSAASLALGRLGKSNTQSRQDASHVWDNDSEGTVVDVAKTKTGWKVITNYTAPTKEADKLVFRQGQKGTTALIIPDERMPRTEDGKPLEVLLNHLGVPSRVNNALPYEIMLGKVAEKQGAPIKVPSFLPKGQAFYDFVDAKLKEAGVAPEERVYDPELGRFLEQPVTVGNAYLLKLHHTGDSKVSQRGTASYTVNEQPAKGGSEGAQAKRRSALEVSVMQSAGAYANIREGATLQGQKNDEFWRQFRDGFEPKRPGAPFVWHKFRALLTGAGLRTKDVEGDAGEKSSIRLGAFTDKDLDALNPVEVHNGGIVDMRTLEPVKGGLFDPGTVGSGKYGFVRLPRPVINPAFEDTARQFLGLTKAQLRDVLAGNVDLDAVRKK